MSRLRTPLAVLAAGTALLLAGCSGEESPSPETAGSSAPTSSAASATPTKPAAAKSAPTPAKGACYRLSYDQALAPTATRKPTPCSTRDTTTFTFEVGQLSTNVGGHLLAVDSARVRNQPATTCPAALSRFVGGGTDALRLSVLRSVWFTPTVEQSDAGASWFRCDLVALAEQGELAPLVGRLRGVLATPEGRTRYGLCSPAEPGTTGYLRIPCSQKHSWRAIQVVDIAGDSYPGEDTVRAAGQSQCENAGRDAASDPLDFTWGYEWPTKEQWADGQDYGLCWAPD
ncbi:septum formation family protein [Nocardioides acrostichi]|uniref:Septum formation family protein n=1 Tax=Nocardioides acrostichi TaxID=2784339 RepID=A0A930Y7G7_9ACTN|nr:septum formation family protein [Nocardioides acrostichi]MBF4163400.1 septum formation family protein [Nocardioides acrostichi]